MIEMRLLGAMLVLATMEFGGVALSEPSAPRATDEVALRSLIATGGEAWSNGDVEGLAATWAEDGELIGGEGSYHVGRPRITEYLTRLLTGPWKGSRFVADITSVRFLGPDVAVLHLNAGFVKAGELEPAAENRAVQSVVAVRERNTWRVTLYQSTRVRPPSAPKRN